MKKSFIILLSFLVISLSSKAQDPVPAAEETSPFNMTVSLNSDIFFGFYPFFAGSYGLSETSAFTFYGILWSGGTGAAWGNWTEFGVGMSFAPVEGLNINPQIGILNGSLTSGLGTPTLGEGVVPNLTVQLDRANLEGEFYGGYYAGFDHGNLNTNNYLHYWLNGGYKFGTVVSAGLHFEQLRFTGGQNYAESLDPAYDYYKVFGPYIQFSAPNGNAFARFTTGGDLRDDEMVTKSGYDISSFYKLSVGYSF